MIMMLTWIMMILSMMTIGAVLIYSMSVCYGLHMHYSVFIQQGPLLPPFYRRGDWGSEVLGKLTRSQQACGWAQSRAQVCLTTAFIHNYPFCIMKDVQSPPKNILSGIPVKYFFISTVFRLLDKLFACNCFHPQRSHVSHHRNAAACRREEAGNNARPHRK